jgi:uncharacterized protein (DUF2235 family)
VSSVGLVKEDVFLSSSSSAEHACYFRHALALDEKRVKFMSEYFYEMNTVTDDKSAGSAWKSKYILGEELGVVDELTLTATDDEKFHGSEVETVKKAGGNSKASKTSDVKEVWFAGSHSDVYVYVPSFHVCMLIAPSFKWWKESTREVFPRGQRFAHVDAPRGR